MTPKIKIYKNKFSNPKFSYISICVLVGSIYENEKEKGISHFIEHLIFKGSEYNENIKILNNRLNRMGMYINAYTTQFITNYYIETPTIYIKEAIDALIQIVFNPFFRKKDIDNERKIVINELIERMSSPESLAEIKAQELIYSKNNPLSNPIIGYIKTIKKISQDDILNYYRKYYQPKNIIFFTSSNKNERSIKNLWNNSYKQFGNPNQKYDDIESTLSIFKKMIPELSLINKPKKYNLTNFFPKNDSNYILFNIFLPKLKEKELFQLDILSNYLAGSLSSKLFLILRENKQLIYSISSDISISINSTILSLDFNCKKNNKIVNECLNIINRTLKELIVNGIPISEFNKFKLKSIINYNKIKSDGSYKISRYIENIIFNVSSYKYEKYIKSTTNISLNKLIKKILKEQKQYIFIA